MFVCIQVCLIVGLHPLKYVCMFVWFDVFMYICMCNCMLSSFVEIILSCTEVDSVLCEDFLFFLLIG